MSYIYCPAPFYIVINSSTSVLLHFRVIRPESSTLRLWANVAVFTFHVVITLYSHFRSIYPSCKVIVFFL